MKGKDHQRLMVWVGSEILPHEADVRVWLRRTFNPDDLEDIIQEAYAQIASLDDVSHIRNARAYFFTVVRSLVLMKLRRARVVKIETIAEIDSLGLAEEAPSPERITAGRRELERVRGLIDGLPERCRKVFELRKIQGLSQREVAGAIGLPEHIVENEVRRGLKLILQAIAETEHIVEQSLATSERNERTRNTSSDT